MNTNSGNQGLGHRPATDRQNQHGTMLSGFLRYFAPVAKFSGYVGGIALLGLIFGFLWFQGQIDDLRAEPAGSADAIAVLTGGQYRVATGLRLLEKGKGSRLLISGVHNDTSRAALLRVSGRDTDTAPCCIDVGHDATNTVENAIEITHWVEANGYESLLVVTSDYHMPRALAEISALAPRLELVPHIAREKEVKPLRPRQADASMGASKLVMTEYAKYVAALVRIRLNQ